MRGQRDISNIAKLFVHKHLLRLTFWRAQTERKLSKKPATIIEALNITSDKVTDDHSSSTFNFLLRKQLALNLWDREVVWAFNWFFSVEEGRSSCVIKIFLPSFRFRFLFVISCGEEEFWKHSNSADLFKRFVCPREIFQDKYFCRKKQSEKGHLRQQSLRRIGIVLRSPKNSFYDFPESLLVRLHTRLSSAARTWSCLFG